MEKKVSVNENNLVSLVKTFAADIDCSYCPFSANCDVFANPENCEKVLAKVLDFELKTEEEKWVEEILEKITKDNRCSFYRQDKTVVCVCKYDTGSFAVGIANCHNEDEFNMEIGKAIAYARAKKWSIPKDL